MTGLLDDDQYVPRYTPHVRYSRKVTEEENLREIAKLKGEKWDPTPKD